ncbi:MAG TPA: hypothetical protein VLC92_02020 [Rhodocyclaceae bacterium]|nr:hypothetical protein [Rhodocyclaceae bacterium]
MIEADGPTRFEGIPFDPQRGEVIFLPAHTYELTLLAVEPEGSRELGPYVFRHQPWPAA